MTELEEKIGNLIKVESHEDLLDLLEAITSLKENETVIVATRSIGGNQLMWNDKCIFTFDMCRYGNANHNAISILRDVLKMHNPQAKWTRKRVESLVHWTNEVKKAV
ncbi:MAG: hypothetical protein WCP92_07465 [bacterium]